MLIMSELVDIANAPARFKSYVEIFNISKMVKQTSTVHRQCFFLHVLYS